MFYELDRPHGDLPIKSTRTGVCNWGGGGGGGGGGDARGVGVGGGVEMRRGWTGWGGRCYYRNTRAAIRTHNFSILIPVS